MYRTEASHDCFAPEVAQMQAYIQQDISSTALSSSKQQRLLDLSLLGRVRCRLVLELQPRSSRSSWYAIQGWKLVKKSSILTSMTLYREQRHEHNSLLVEFDKWLWFEAYHFLD